MSASSKALPTALQPMECVRTSFQVSELSSLIFVLTLFLLMLTALSGCGSGGYAGGGVVSLSASAVTIDAGQTFSVTSTVSGGVPVTWSLSGSTCTGAACGTLSTATGTSETYTAPSGTTAPFVVTLKAGGCGHDERADGGDHGESGPGNFRDAAAWYGGRRVYDDAGGERWDRSADAELELGCAAPGVEL